MTKWQHNFHFLCHIFKLHTKLSNFCKRSFLIQCLVMKLLFCDQMATKCDILRHFWWTIIFDLCPHAGPLWNALHTCICAYLHSCIHAYLHTCISAYLHTRIIGYLNKWKILMFTNFLYWDKQVLGGTSPLISRGIL